MSNTIATATIGLSEDAILRWLWQFSFLTAEQIKRLGYSPTVISYVRGRLRTLHEGGYINREYMLKPGGRGPYRFSLGKKGVAYLREAGAEILYYPSDHTDVAYLFQRHTEAVNDVLIAAVLLSRTEKVRIEEIRTEPWLKRSPMKVEVKGEKIAVIPDAWVAFSSNFIALELDRGTEDQKVWRRKVRGYSAAVKWRGTSEKPIPSVYKEVYGVDRLIIAVVTTAGERRAKTLRAWTEAELGRASKLASLFQFTYLPEGVPDPEELFLANRWYQPFSEAPTPLLG